MVQQEKMKTLSHVWTRRGREVPASVTMSQNRNLLPISQLFLKKTSSKVTNCFIRTNIIFIHDFSNFNVSLSKKKKKN